MCNSDWISSAGEGCSLSSTKILNYLDTNTRTWTVNEDVLDALENDLQIIVECTKAEDTILLDLSEIQLADRVVIRHELTIRGLNRNASLGIESAQLAPAKTIIRCPFQNKGSFLLKYLLLRGHVNVTLLSLGRPLCSWRILIFQTVR